MNARNEFWFDVFFLTLGCAFLFGAFLGSYPLTVPDEGRYAEIAREMFASGNYITPYLDGTAFLDKPILFFWIEAFFIKLFGVNEWAVRLLPSLAGTIGVLSTYWAGRKLYDRRTGLLSAVILGSSFFYFGMARYVNMDMLVAVLISVTLWIFIVAVHEPIGRKRTILLLTMYLFSGLAFLSKGVIGAALPGLVVFTWMLLLNRWYLLKNLHILKGLGIFILVTLPWYALVQYHNPEFFNYFFVYQQFSRFISTALFHRYMPLYFYPALIIGGMLPWTFFLIQSVVYFFKKIKNSWQNADKEIFILLWPVLILIFFSIPATKLAGYIVPVFAPIAMILGKYLSDHWSSLKDKLSLRIVALCFFALNLVAVIVFAIIPRSNPQLASVSPYVYALLGWFLLCASIGIVLVFSKKRFQLFFILILLSTIIGEIGVAPSIINVYAYNKGTKTLALFLRNTAKQQDRIIGYHAYYFDLPFYLNRTIDVVLSVPWMDAAMNNNHNWQWQSELAEDVIHKYQQQEHLLDPSKFITLWQSHIQVFVVADEANRAQLQALPHATFIKENNGIVVFSNRPLKQSSP